MRIPLLYIPKTQFKHFLYIEKNYKTLRPVISVGCDCHPAHCLQKLHIRQHSYPFDWLNTQPENAIEYVVDNIENGFSHFIKNLGKNEAGNVIATHYPYAEFIHEPDLATNKGVQEKMTRRCKRFTRIFQDEAVDLLCNIPAEGIKDTATIQHIATTVNTLSTKIKTPGRICIYIRYDEHTEENALLSNQLITLLSEMPNVSAAKYCRRLSKYGLWGNASDYPALFASLGIKLSLQFPKIYIR